MVNQNSCGSMIKQIHDELEKNANNAMRVHDITMAQCSALLMLNGAPDRQMALKELERELRVAQSTAAGIVSRLEQKGLAEGFGSPEDKRVKMVRITQQGKAVEALDHCVEEVAKAVESVGGQLLITADHGNAEQMRDPATGQAHTAHTNLPVPLIYVGDKNVKAVEGGKLSDIAPTMLSLMGMEIPQEMTGKPLFIVE